MLDHIQQVINYLNDLLDHDEEAISMLVDTRIRCNESLADHPTCQVQASISNDKEILEVGLLGVLNGLFGVRPDGRCWIVARYEQSKLLGFELNKD